MTELTKSSDADERCSDPMIQCVVDHVLSMHNDRDSNHSANPPHEITSDLFTKYAQCLHSEDDIIRCFQRSQSILSSLRDAEKSNNFEFINSVSTLSTTMDQIRIFRNSPIPSISSDFTSKCWTAAISKFAFSNLPELMTLASNLKAKYDDDRALNILESDCFGDSQRMTLITTSMDSAFWSLTADQMESVVECDKLALSEEALFNALKRWCSQKDDDDDDIKRFVPMLRFPMMSMQFLVDEILPIRGQLFEADDFLHIVLHKMCVQQKQCDFNDSKTSNPFKLCCPSTPRMSADATSVHLQSESTANLPLDVRVVAFCAENDKLRAQIEELRALKSSKTLNSSNTSKSGKTSKSPKSPTSFKSEHGVAAQSKSKSPTKANLKKSRNSKDRKERGHGVAASDLFTSRSHFEDMRRQKAERREAQSHKATDDLDVIQQKMSRLHHGKASPSMINAVHNLNVGDSTVDFVVKTEGSDSKESLALYAALRERMSARAEPVRSKKKRDREHAKRESLSASSTASTTATKRKKNENKKKKKTKRKKRDSASLSVSHSRNVSASVSVSANEIADELTAEPIEPDGEGDGDGDAVAMNGHDDQV